MNATSLGSLTEQVGQLTPNTPAERDAARTTITAHAHDADDLALLLAVVGL